MSYELWDTEAGNLVEAFEDERSALAATGDLIAVNVGVYPAMLTLIASGDRGDLSTIATGDQLGVRAASAVSENRRRSG
jgi:hypothetical protein